MAGAGERDKRVTFERAQKVKDAFNANVTADWLPIGKAYARVRYGAASEQRTAALEKAAQTATFATTYSAKLLAVTTADRIVFDGRNWQISATAPSRDRGEILFTGTTTTAAS